MIPQWIIEKKRDGNPLSEKEIQFFLDSYNNGTIPDYQMSALAMAIYYKGMTFDEVAIFTDVMMNSGCIMDTSSISIPKADKHSTGGIGDKVSLLLAPLAACCGIAVPMISGRGLGITGGTLDKLESIPGYRTDLSPDEWLDVIQKCGCSIIGQTSEIAPTDKKLYALRDVTGTVPSIPLISASIMSKKMAEGVDALVLDVKRGKGAFMKTTDDARELARTMVEIGKRLNKKMTALITDMDQPLGRSAGNTVEVIETIEALKGNGAPDLIAETIELTAHMITLSDKTIPHDQAVSTVTQHLESGAGFEKFKEMVQLHGGSVESIDDTSKLPTAAIITPLNASNSGYVAEVNAELIGRACIVLGAGRTKTDDPVDHAVGLTNMLKTGTAVDKGEPLLTIHANSSEKTEEASKLIEQAISISTTQPESPTLILETIK